MNGEPIDGLVAVVTGASRGIGEATARALSAAGASVVLAARDEGRLSSLAAELVAGGRRALGVVTDVTDPQSVNRLVGRTIDVFGRLDIAVNNAAGGERPPTPLADVALQDFDDTLSVDLRGVFLSMKHEIPAMLAGTGGAIVNMASTAGLEAVGGLAGYVASKFAVIGLTRTAALDYAGAGIRVNALAPGPVLTDHLARAGVPAQQAAAHRIPIGRVGRPDEIAAAAVWLCSPAASFVTGTTLTIDGGKLAGMAPFGRPAGRREP